MKADQEVLYQKRPQEAAAAQKKTLVEERVQSQVEELSEQMSLHLELLAELEAEKEPLDKLPEELCSQEMESLPNAPAVELHEETGGPEEKLPEEEEAFWKRRRHLLCFRKPERCQIEGKHTNLLL